MEFTFTDHQEGLWEFAGERPDYTPGKEGERGPRSKIRMFVPGPGTEQILNEYLLNG